MAKLFKYHNQPRRKKGLLGFKRSKKTTQHTAAKTTKTKPAAKSSGLLQFLKRKTPKQT